MWNLYFVLSTIFSSYIEKYMFHSLICLSWQLISGTAEHLWCKCSGHNSIDATSSSRNAAERDRPICRGMNPGCHISLRAVYTCCEMYVWSWTIRQPHSVQLDHLESLLILIIWWFGYCLVGEQCGRKSSISWSNSLFSLKTCCQWLFPLTSFWGSHGSLNTSSAYNPCV